jgi:hypothetical protein
MKQPVKPISKRMRGRPKKYVEGDPWISEGIPRSTYYARELRKKRRNTKVEPATET